MSLPRHMKALGKMMGEELYWKGELLGHISDIQYDMASWYGRWKPTNGLQTSEFHAAVAKAMANWEEEIAGVDAYLDSESKEVVEVTEIKNGFIAIHVNPALWPSYKSNDAQPTEPIPANSPKRWWQFWKR